VVAHLKRVEFRGFSFVCVQKSRRIGGATTQSQQRVCPARQTGENAKQKGRGQDSHIHQIGIFIPKLCGSNSKVTLVRFSLCQDQRLTGRKEITVKQTLSVLFFL
jgi:hypothetical protein